MLDWDLEQSCDRFLVNGGGTVENTIEVFCPAFKNSFLVCDQYVPILFFFTFPSALKREDDPDEVFFLAEPFILHSTQL